MNKEIRDKRDKEMRMIYKIIQETDCSIQYYHGFRGIKIIINWANPSPELQKQILELRNKENGILEYNGIINSEYEECYYKLIFTGDIAQFLDRIHFEKMLKLECKVQR